MPVSEGGLGVSNPIIDTLVVRDSIQTYNPSMEFLFRKDQDLKVYEIAKERWEAEGEDEECMSWEEYLGGQEVASLDWGLLWYNLQQISAPSAVKKSKVSDQDPKWYSRGQVEQWVVEMYGEEIVNTFGAMKIVEPTLIPVGMLSAFRDSKIAWDT
jgi:hypothetical protein